MIILAALILLYIFSLVLSSGKNIAGKRLYISKYFLFFVLLAHALFIIQRGIEVRRFPVVSTYETVILFAWLVALIGIILYFRYNFSWLRWVSVLCSCFLLLLSMFISSDIHALMPSLKSGWLFFHVVAYFIAYASFAIAFGLSLIFIVLSLGKRKREAFRDLRDNLEGLIFRIIDIGFPFLTMGIATGAIWANLTWGRFWSWDAKEIWALVTWLIYSACLHLRHTRNLKGIHGAIVACVGFIAVIVTYIGVNLLFSTIHSYS